ncbi:MAG: LamG domain-containing protein, partial [Nanoarchaeota archaeon]|nr:LamG domain-containing protein [Nanoarchaeota archaeon]
MNFDGTSPGIFYNLETPANNSALDTVSFVVNTSSSDASDHYVFTDFDSSLVLWMRFDDVNGSSDPTDISQYSNNGSYSSNAGPVLTNQGYFGDAMAFERDGNSKTGYIEIPASDSLNLTSGLSASVWVKPTEEGVFPNEGIIAGESGFLSQRWQISMEYDDDSFYFQSSSGGSVVSPSSSLPVDEWSHIGVVANTTNIYLYINGMLVNSSSGSYTYGDDVTKIALGSHLGQICGYPKPCGFNGTIDEILVFNRTLSASEMASLYNASETQYHNTFNGLGNGETHIFQSYAVDAAGNMQSEDQRTVSIDFDFPGVSFDPSTIANGTVQSTTSAFVNLTTSGGEHYSFVDFGRDLILWMRMDDVNGSGDLVDSSSYSNNGSAENGAVRSGDGLFGEGVFLDGGDDYVSIPYSSEMNSGDAYTVSLWAKPSGSDPSGWVFSAYEDPSDNLGIRETSNTWRVWYDLNNAGDDSTINLGAIDSDWQHIVVIFNQSGIWGYKDGTLIDNDTILSGSFNNLSNPLYFIGYNGGGLNWNGSIDELLVFNRSLSSVEIQALYNSSAYSYEYNFTSLGSGVYNFTGYAVDNAGNVNETETRSIEITPQPEIGLDVLYPSGDINVTQNEFFNVTLNVSCLAGSCGEVNVTLDPEQTVSVYNFSNLNDGKRAYCTSVGSDTPLAPGSGAYQEINVSCGTYSDIESDDSNRMVTSGISGGFTNLWYNFSVAESLPDITSVEVRWVGYDQLTNGDDFEFDIWNHSSSSWVVINTTVSSESSDVDYGAIFSSSDYSLDDFIGDGDLYLGVSGSKSSPAPICLSSDTLISTPHGEKKISQIKQGDFIYS